ncbi:hypothetical protein [Absidia glauca]|uniref:Homeobox domain-containing protein n=1 Tax=Absidia glauca TaxID=4829 RepID=A0A168LUK8_ABSGL|nr:hypothetical protein [Absidia glauca]
MTLRTTPPPNIELRTTAQRRARIKPDMKAKLELEYKKNPKPDKKEKHRMALAFDMTDDNVHFWFQNRRARASRESKRRSAHGKETMWPQVSVTTPLEDEEPVVKSSVNPRETASSSKTQQVDKPCLPHIFTLWEGTYPSSSPFVSMHDQIHTSFIPTYYHHSPFGIESSYLKWQQTEETRPPTNGGV